MNELQAIAQINRNIKSIVHAAENISLTATNAILVARKTGVNAVGFNIVACELRIFSEKITNAMQELSVLIYQQVVITANKCHRLRNVVFLKQAISYGELAQTRVTCACERSQNDVDKMERLIFKLQQELKKAIRRTAKQCATGLVIARSASIEASHGAEMTSVLRQVAQGVEDVVSDIVMQIKKLETQFI